jgi:hypothetical protein
MKNDKMVDSVIREYKCCSSQIKIIHPLGFLKRFYNFIYFVLVALRLTFRKLVVFFPKKRIEFNDNSRRKNKAIYRVKRVYIKLYTI